jgi:hypothetical protein
LGPLGIAATNRPIDIPNINDVYKEKRTTHHNKLASHSNDIL